MKGKKRFLAAVLAAVLVLGLCAGSALAAEPPVMAESSDAEEWEEGQIAEYGSARESSDIRYEHLGDTKYRIIVRGADLAGQVLVPTWSSNNGQDDLIWYGATQSSNGEWSVVINTSVHGGGLMISHVYADGELYGGIRYKTRMVGRPRWDIDMSWGGSYYAIIISNLRGASDVLLPTWGVRDEQNDLRWYRAHYDGNNCWSVLINSQDHDIGRILTHIYVDGIRIGETSVARYYPVVTDFRFRGRAVNSYANISLMYLQNLLGAAGKKADGWVNCGWQWTNPLIYAFCNSSYSHVYAVEFEARDVYINGTRLELSGRQIRELIGNPPEEGWHAWPEREGGIYTLNYKFEGWQVQIQLEDGPDSMARSVYVTSIPVQL